MYICKTNGSSSNMFSFQIDLTDHKNRNRWFSPTREGAKTYRWSLLFFWDIERTNRTEEKNRCLPKTPRVWKESSFHHNQSLLFSHGISHCGHQRGAGIRSISWLIMPCAGQKKHHINYHIIYYNHHSSAGQKRHHINHYITYYNHHTLCWPVCII